MCKEILEYTRKPFDIQGIPFKIQGSPAIHFCDVTSSPPLSWLQ